MRPCGTAHRDDFQYFINFICRSPYQYRLSANIGAHFRLATPSTSIFASQFSSLIRRDPISRISVKRVSRYSASQLRAYARAPIIRELTILPVPLDIIIITHLLENVNR